MYIGVVDFQEVVLLDSSYKLGPRLVLSWVRVEQVNLVSWRIRRIGEEFGGLISPADLQI